jgi:hypothetical protein
MTATAEPWLRELSPQVLGVVVRRAAAPDEIVLTKASKLDLAK